jgi:hypothetical protein
MKHPNSFTPAEVWQTNKTEVIASAIIAIAAIIDFCYGSWFLGAITLLLSAMFLINAYLLTYIGQLQDESAFYATNYHIAKQKFEKAQALYESTHDELINEHQRLLTMSRASDKEIATLKKTINRQQRELNNTRKDVESWKAQCRKHESNAQ